MPVDRGPLLIDGLQAESQMPFSSLRDPIDVSRSRGGLELAWSRIRPLLAREDREREHARLRRNRQGQWWAEDAVLPERAPELANALGGDNGD